MPWMRFVLQILPITGLAMVSTVVGLFAMPVEVGFRLEIPLLLLGLLLFVTMQTFKNESGWNVTLLLGFSLVVGAILSVMGGVDSSRGWIFAIGGMTFILASAALVGRFLRGRFAVLGVGLWMSSWVYLFGWGAIALLHLEESLLAIWALAGLVIFAGLSVVWFAGIADRAREDTVPALAMDLYILGINLAIAARLLA
ncbi:MAG: hypothetical protein GTO14_18870 [Anaerolineales bacterium]|nr:hypothetical protein [Anaerolineales bacterium]